MNPFDALQSEPNRSYGDPPTSLQLRQGRQRIVEFMRTITHASEQQNRGLTETERGAFEAADAEFQRHAGLLAAAEAREQEEAANARSLGNSNRDFRIPTNRDNRPAVLTRSQSLADHVRSTGYRVENEPDLGFGRLVRGLLTGDWRGADLERRTMLESNAGSGGVLVPAPMSAKVLDVARAS